MNNSKNIANLLIKASKDVVIKEAEDWLKEKHPNSQLFFKVGSGKKTYHSLKSKNNSIIVYGKKMIDSKLDSELSCGLWLTSREIKDRKYFQGKITPQTSIAAVVLHETAHYFQCLNKKRYLGSVHNDFFYKVLDRMHEKGVASRVYDYLNSYSDFRKLKFINENKTLNIYPKELLSRGEAFYFSNPKTGEVIKDYVVKLNPKKVLGLKFYVPYSLVVEPPTV